MVSNPFALAVEDVQSTRTSAFDIAADRMEWDRKQLEIASDPVTWVGEILGETLWSKQAEIARSVRDNRRTAVQSCHDVGKSFVASRIVAWWIAAHPPGEAFVVTSAPTFQQVRAILWREINKAHAKGNLIGDTTETEWKINKELVGFGRKPSDYSMTAFQGIHARYVLVVLDEACHDDQTDVLTETGWKRFADLTLQDRLLTMDPETHVATYRHPEKIIAKPYSGPMFLYEAKGANYCVTPDHEMYFHGRSHNHDTEWRKAPVSSLATKHDAYMKKTIVWDAADVETHTIPELVGDRKVWPERVVDMDLWLEFLGWYLSEGHVIRRGERVYGVGISQNDPETLSQIHKICLALDLPASIYGKQVHIHSRQIGEHLAASGRRCIEKRVPPYAKNVSARQLNILLDAYEEGDGYRKGRGGVIYTSSPQMADDLQEMILKTSRPSVIHRRALAGTTNWVVDHEATSSVDGFVITRPHQDSKIKHSPRNLTTVDYDGMVYCARVSPEHLLFTRRNGYTMWSGNCGVPESLWDAADTLITNESSRILAIGNPDDPTSEFAKICQPNTDWHKIRISAYDSPNFTNEDIPDPVREVLVSPVWVEEKKKKWSENHPFWQSKVLGLFPQQSATALLPLSLLLDATRHDYTPVEGDPRIIGVDVARFGTDKTVFALREGQKGRIVFSVMGSDTMETAAKVKAYMRRYKANLAAIDTVGVGGGVFDRMVEDNENVISMQAASRAVDYMTYANSRAEWYWHVREMLEAGELDLDPEDEELIEQLAGLQYKIDTRGRIVLESKEDMKKRGLDSPDRADALALAFGRNDDQDWGAAYGVITCRNCGFTFVDNNQPSCPKCNREIG